MSKTFTLLLFPLLLAGTIAAAGNNNATDDGPHSCGGVEIPYPFGIGNGSFRKGFEITCEAGTPVLPNTNSISIPIKTLSIVTAEARVLLPVGRQCYNSSGDVVSSSYTEYLMFNKDDVYRISNSSNDLYVLGCNTVAFLGSKPVHDLAQGNNDDYSFAEYTGCLCYCGNAHSAADGACSGVGCCSVAIPPDLTDNQVSFDSYDRTRSANFSPCDYAFLAEKGSYTFHAADLKMDEDRKMLVVLDWAIRNDNLTCQEAQKKKAYACVSSNSICLNSSSGPGYVCNCSAGYEGNPYIKDGCINIDECNHPDKYPCKGICKDRQNGYGCICPKHSSSPDPFNQTCTPDFPIVAQGVVGSIAGLFVIAIVVFLILLGKEKRNMKAFFEKNGGPTLEKLNNIKLFKKEDLKKILKDSNVIGKGGFGMVYKGSIGDSSQLVAVKKPINVNLADKDQFANEIIIQSRVIHKNIVKLIGCCLEVDIPILVYEFVPKGSLHDILHGSRRVPLDLDLRLLIAAESAEGLAYMHSKTTTTILHGDVKPANILLNDEFVPKISDFGISRLIATDKQHTGNVIGDMNYMDPVYLQTGLLTNKSDVYSFGVVLLELITRKKASHSDNNSLLRNFLDAYTKSNSAIELLDKDLGVVGDLEHLDSLAGMIKQCLNLDVDQRPDMNDLAERLRDMVKRSKSK